MTIKISVSSFAQVEYQGYSGEVKEYGLVIFFGQLKCIRAEGFQQHHFYFYVIFYFSGMMHLDTADNVEYKVEEGLILDRLELDCLDDLQAAMPLCIDVMYRCVDRTINKFNTE